jgi:hypothetical protein
MEDCMSNIGTLMNAGLIAAGAVFSEADQTTINNLSADEVNALISVSQAVSTDFLVRNCGSSSPGASPTTHPIGIVF